MLAVWVERREKWQADRDRVDGVQTVQDEGTGIGGGCEDGR